MARSTAMTRQLIRDFGTCLSFNGTSAKVIVASNSTIQGMANLTLSFWFKAKDVGAANRKLFFKNGVYDIGLDSSGQLFAEIVGVNNFGIFSSRNMGDNTWHHFVITYDGSTAAAYLDGVSIASTAVVGAPSVASNANDLGFGQHVANGNEWYLGLMDSVRIYNVGLTSAEVTALYYGSEPTSNPVAWWKFDEGSGTTANDSIGTSTGTITNATYSTDVFMKLRNSASGRRYIRDFGKSLNYNGTTAWVSIPSTSALNISNKVITLMAWVYPRTFAGNDKSIIAKMDADATVTYQLRLQATFKRPRFVVDTDAGGVSATTSNTVLENRWTHVAVTYDGTNARFYINGVQDSAPAFTLTPDSTTNAVSIGAKTAGGGDFFNGFIDETFIYNATLTATDILNYYNTGAYPTTGLLAYHKYDEGTGTTTADSSGNNNTGTLSGSTTPAWSTFVRDSARSAA